MSIKYAALAAAGACALVSAAPASAAVFDFATYGLNSSGSLKAGDVTVTATAWSVSNLTSSTMPALAKLGVWTGSRYGLGVTSASDDQYGNTGGRTEQHAIDNVDSYDFVALYFDKAVSLTGLKLNGFAVSSSQTTASTDDWISYASFTGALPTTTAGIQSAMNGLWSTFLTNGKEGAAGSINSALAGKTANVWIVGASRATTTQTRNDGFKLAAVTAVVPASAPMPEPATWAAMLLGFGMVGGAVRRRRTTVAFAA